MNTPTQSGFDFPLDIHPQFAEQPAGTWHTPKFTREEYARIFEVAEARLEDLNWTQRQMFALGLQAARADHAEKLSCWNPRGPYGLLQSQIEPDAILFDQFMVGCNSMIDGDWDSPGHDYKRRVSRFRVETGLHRLDVGTLVVSQWYDGVVRVSFRPTRDPFFRKSYLDDVPMYRVHDDLFADHCCAQALSDSGAGVAKVRVFTHEGRQYVNTGGLYSRDFRSCDAWRFCALDDWRGPTYSDESQSLAWEEGRTQRGDRRGLVVSVRGQLAVLDSLVTFYDDLTGTRRPRPHPC